MLVADEKIQAAFGGITGLPTTFIIDRNGNIAKQHLGFAEREELESEIKPLLMLKGIHRPARKRCLPF